MADNNPEKDGEIRELEALTTLDQRFVLYLTEPFKLTLSELARSRHQSMADIVRTALPLGLAAAYPEFADVYRKHLTHT